MNLEDTFLAWRKERVTIERIESQPILDHNEPLSDAFDEWRELKRLMRPGDELWRFCSPQEEWDRHMGWQGLVAVRGGRLLEVVVTALN